MKILDCSENSQTLILWIVCFISTDDLPFGRLKIYIEDIIVCRPIYHPLSDNFPSRIPQIPHDAMSSAKEYT